MFISKSKLEEIKNDYRKKLKDTEKYYQRKIDEQTSLRNAAELKLSKIKEEKLKLENKCIDFAKENKNLKNKNQILARSKGGLRTQTIHLDKISNDYKQKAEKYEKLSSGKDETIRILTEENNRIHEENRNLIQEKNKLREFIDKKINKKEPTLQQIKDYDKKYPSKKW